MNTNEIEQLKAILKLADSRTRVKIAEISSRAGLARPVADLAVQISELLDDHDAERFFEEIQDATGNGTQDLALSAWKSLAFELQELQSSPDFDFSRDYDAAIQRYRTTFLRLLRKAPSAE
tara:strand:- start:204 stop:566 length:363 start_codon:yes stop_codon:yes gene_type:complete